MKEVVMETMPVVACDSSPFKPSKMSSVKAESGSLML